MWPNIKFTRRNFDVKVAYSTSTRIDRQADKVYPISIEALLCSRIEELCLNLFVQVLQ